MPVLPGASTTVDATAGAQAGGLDTITIIAPVASNADYQPRTYASYAGILAQHGYSEGLEYAALHLEETKKPLVFVGVPVVTEGVVGQVNTAGNSGTSVVGVTAGSGGCRAEHDGVVKVVSGGTIGADQITLSISMDGGRTFKKLKLGTGNAYTIPYFNVSLSFGAGDLEDGDTVISWHGTQSKWDATGLLNARTALADVLIQSRSWLVVGDVATDDDASDIITQANAYETANDRFIFARAQLRDRQPFATMSHTTVRMTAGTSLTFLEVGASADTITRATGSWTADLFLTGDILTITGAAQAGNNGVSVDGVTVTSATVLTMGSEDLVNEVTAGATIVGQTSLTFSNSGETIVRNRGSWLDDGFKVGIPSDCVGTASGTNDFSGVAPTGVTASTLTFPSGTIDADEVIGHLAVTITQGELEAEYVASMNAEFEDIVSEPRLDLALGRGRKLSPITGYRQRRPAAWAISLREYQHAPHIATWQKDHGPLSGWSLEDSSGARVEHDERVVGGALDAGFSCLRTWSNDGGVYVGRSLTRDEENSPLVNTHTMAVVNVAQQVAQRASEAIVGRGLVLNDNGTATKDQLALLASEVTNTLQSELLQNINNEGPMCSSIKYTPSTTDNLRAVDAELNGVVDLVTLGTVVKVNTKIRVNPGA